MYSLCSFGRTVKDFIILRNKICSIQGAEVIIFIPSMALLIYEINPSKYHYSRPVMGSRYFYI